MIYFIHAVGTDLVKIGYTSGSIRKRLESLKTGCPHKLKLVAALEGGRGEERRWHKDFAGDRSHGEWFRVSDRLAEAIGVPAFRPRKAGPSPEPIEVWAISFNDDGFMEYAGQVFREKDQTVRVEVIDALMAYFGPLILSGEYRDIPKSRCRLFNDLEAFKAAFVSEAECIDRHVAARCKAEREANDLEL